MASTVQRRLSRLLLLLPCLALSPSTARADKEVQALAVGAAAVIATTIGSPIVEESDQIAVEAGRLDPVKNVQPTTDFGFEFRGGRPFLWRLQPFVGGGFTADHSFYGYGGIRVAAHWGDHVVATPSFAIGGYSRGDGKDLGTPAVIGRFGLDLEYRFDNDVRIGVAYHHMSNGKVLGQEINPGTEVIGITLSMPVH